MSNAPDHFPGTTPNAPPRVEYARPKRTRRSVLLADHAARRIIITGGVAVIAAVLGILVFLVWQVVPLFRGGALTGVVDFTQPPAQAPVAAVFWDEYRSVLVELGKDGGAAAYHAATGAPLEVASLKLGEAEPRAFAVDAQANRVVFGLSDGSLNAATVDFEVAVLPAGTQTDGARPAGEGQWVDATAVYSRIAGEQLRSVTPRVRQDPEPVVGAGFAPRALALCVAGEGPSRVEAIAVLDVTGGLTLHLARARQNLLTGRQQLQVRSYPLPAPPGPLAEPRLLVTEGGTAVLVCGADGTLYRYNTRTPAQPVLAETVRITAPGVEVSALAFLTGRQAFVVGGSDGSVNVAFAVSQPGGGTADGLRTRVARELPPHDAAVRAVIPSTQGKSFLTADAAGAVWLRHATSEKVLLRFPRNGRAPAAPRLLALAPRLNGVLLGDADGHTQNWGISVPHPETSWRTLFGKVWYEGYPEPAFTWQSSAGTDDFESKLSLVPLIFGTVKATIYSLLFAVPVALLAAVFTSEFLDKRVRGLLKSSMEMMASLPSVVLGFVAALVLAPVIERWIGAVLLGILAVPLALVAGAYLWQFLPRRLADRHAGLTRFGLMVTALLAGFGFARAFGGPFEELFFGGAFTRWLEDRSQGATPFLFFLLLPLGLFVALWVGARLGDGRVRDRLRRLSGWRAGLLDLGRAATTTAAACGLAFAGALSCQALGLDPRDGLVGTYVQRNTLLVAFAMGFAVIPLVYTIAEDALAAVPDHLRGASLGCGATQWQTTLWVVIPAAMSGLFAAVMIGMGRAVGETMVVLMAAGNTPIMELNPFNGLRALSANIAVELPEAVVGGTLYRTLFLSGLVLFAMTFVINTVAESIRLRFRKRFRQL